MNFARSVPGTSLAARAAGPGTSLAPLAARAAEAAALAAALAWRRPVDCADVRGASGAGAGAARDAGACGARGGARGGLRARPPVGGGGARLGRRHLGAACGAARAVPARGADRAALRHGDAADP